MKVLWLTWKDSAHPQAGGAEVVASELGKRLVADGHEVIFLTAGFSGAAYEGKQHGARVIRVGNRYSVYWKAHQYYKKNLQGWADVVIDEMNTMPFFTKFYVKERKIMFVHQLCREIWFYNMVFPFSLIGYVAEMFYLRLVNDQKVITVSESTKRDLMRFGFREENISIISEGIDIEPITEAALEEKLAKGIGEQPLILSVGRTDPMKRTHHIIEAFNLLKNDIPQARLTITGSMEGYYGKKLSNLAAKSPYAVDISFPGRVSQERKKELLGEAAVLAMASVKEGWGLVVTEANSQGTPAVVYDAGGLRDSVRDQETGIVLKKNSPGELALSLSQILSNGDKYKKILREGWAWSTSITFTKAYKNFYSIIKFAP